MKRIVALLLLPLVVILFVTACGKKVDPRPKVRQVAMNLSTTYAGNETALCWSYTDTTMNIDTVTIMRSAFRTEFSQCADCPKNFVVVKTFKKADLALAKQATNGWCYHDSDVKHGFLYTYKLSLCDEKGNCITPATTTEIKY
ncbi:MAG: hypothetical protein WCJ49_05635 [Deltaproteobacteria bacterium]